MIYVYCIVIPVLGCCLMCLVAGFIIYRKRKQKSLDDKIEGAEPYKTNSVDAIVEESQVTTEFFIMKRMETRILKSSRRSIKMTSISIITGSSQVSASVPNLSPSAAQDQT